MENDSIEIFEAKLKKQWFASSIIYLTVFSLFAFLYNYDEKQNFYLHSKNFTVDILLNNLLAAWIFYDYTYKKNNTKLLKLVLLFFPIKLFAFAMNIYDNWEINVAEILHLAIGAWWYFLSIQLYYLSLKKRELAESNELPS